MACNGFPSARNPLLIFQLFMDLSASVSVLAVNGVSFLRLCCLSIIASLALLLSLFSNAIAAESSVIRLEEIRPQSSLWLNAGFYSYHFRRDRGLDDTNPGFGIEYQYSSVAAFTAGAFRNSEYSESRYLGWYYQPVRAGPFRLGAALGAFDGYQRMRSGGWFLAAVPVLTIESDQFGVNIGFIPDYQNRLNGAVTFQLKIRAF